MCAKITINTSRFPSVPTIAMSPSAAMTVTPVNKLGIYRVSFVDMSYVALEYVIMPDLKTEEESILFVKPYS